MNDKGKADSQRKTLEMVTDLPSCAFGYGVTGHFKMGFFLLLSVEGKTR